MAVHEALIQRIVVRFHLPPLTRDETAAYLSHLLRRAGTELPLFEPAAVEVIFQAAQGLPRKINRLAHHTLVAAAIAKVMTVTADHVAEALPEVT
jgi:type II secretory pathway predicted ATPase ExeA